MLFWLILVAKVVAQINPPDLEEKDPCYLPRSALLGPLKRIQKRSIPYSPGASLDKGLLGIGPPGRN
jgi:hypothetical protein